MNQQTGGRQLLCVLECHIPFCLPTLRSPLLKQPVQWSEYVSHVGQAIIIQKTHKRSQLPSVLRFRGILYSVFLSFRWMDAISEIWRPRYTTDRAMNTHLESFKCNPCSSKHDVARSSLCRCSASVELETRT